MKKYVGSITISFLILMVSACGKKNDGVVKTDQDTLFSSEQNRQSTDVANENTTAALDETLGHLDVTSEHTESSFGKEDTQMSEMIVEIDGQSFRALLYNNDTVRELMDSLPMTIRMDELNGNEKFYYMNSGLPTNPQNMDSIQTGDIMLYGSDCLVIFFEHFITSYSYTRIGYIENADDFAKMLGKGTVEMSFRKTN